VSAFGDLQREHGFEPLRIEGELPVELRGTLYRCGPARTSCFGHPYRHAFDGDGAVTAVRFDRGRVLGAVRLVETPGLLAERAAGKALYPAYGTLPPGPPRPLPRPKHAANINVVPWEGRLLALHEAGAPVEIDDELRTLGQTDLGAPSMQQGFSAHPHEARGALFNIGVHYGRTTELELYALRDGHARSLVTHALAGPTMIHDFALTGRHAIVFAPPLRLDLRAFATGLVSYSDALQWRPELGTEVLVIPLDEPERVTRFTVDPFFHWHVASAYSRDREVVVHLVRYPDFASNAGLTAIGGELVRVTIEGSSLVSEPVTDVAVEFPHATPEAVFALGRRAPSGLLDRVVRVGAAGGCTEAVFDPGQVPSEPIFVPSDDDDGGWILSLVYAATEQASHVAVLRASDLECVARVWFDHPIPYTLHGSWNDAGTPIVQLNSAARLP
jgi:all-trans-8'-apo-beta-carotenal 15,15'-oxygenase